MDIANFRRVDTIQACERSRYVGRVRLLLKKRGHRWTGSGELGSVGEGAFFFACLLLGACGLIVLLASHLLPTLSHLAFGSGVTVVLVLLFISLLVIGIGGLAWTTLELQTSQERRSDLARRAAELSPPSSAFPPARDYPTIPCHENLFDSPGAHLAFRLPMRAQPAWSILAAVTYCLMWDGLFCLALMVLLARGISGPVGWMQLPVAAALGYMGYRSTLFALRRWSETVRIGPTHVEVSALPFQSGGEYELAVIQYGSRTIRQIEVLLVCDEETKYREGTDTRVERRRVREMPILANGPLTLKRGIAWIARAKFKCPPDAMHSFQSGSNSIEWTICVRGSLEPQGTFQREFSVIVFPPLRPRRTIR